jgi:hypothetical protein
MVDRVMRSCNLERDRAFRRLFVQLVLKDTHA